MQKTWQGIYDSMCKRGYDPSYALFYADEWEKRRMKRESTGGERTALLVLIALMAQRLGLKVGIGIDGEEDNGFRSVLIVDLPVGQASWRIHDSETSMFYFVGAYDGERDQHTAEENDRRVVEPGL